ncbi:hypothetical protein O6H91_01G171800 [Diphasiastrum complanatum]|uniref:Uncharacterized protein n=1 Tax=Diphasiastrum complanatum TaxID=34168 RepID=A0ACC2EYV9_DIPCM|nr:hypothetical protein O6H91_01G171800 [Diphasiastrum complanatum]
MAIAREEEGMTSAMLVSLFGFLLPVCFFCHAAEHVMSLSPGTLGFSNSLQDPKYKIDFHPLGSHVALEPGQETITMTDRDGQKYECILPKLLDPPSSNNEPNEPNSSSIRLATDVKSTRKTPEDLLNILNGTCLLRLEGWWTYELCYHGHFRQIHLENKKLVEEYILGYYDADATAALHEKSPNISFQKDPRSQTAAQRYHAHMYTNGTKCDLTNEPRETEVRFVCSETGTALISSIKEAPTCKYTVVFQAPSLCKHPLFQEDQQPWVVINCNQISSNNVPPEETQDSTAADEHMLMPYVEEPEADKMVESS